MKLVKVKNIVEKKPKLHKVNKSSVDVSLSPDLDCEYYDNFPFRPTIKKKEVITTVSQLKNLAKKMESIPAFAYDTETNTLSVLSDNNNFKCVGVSISWGDNNNYYIPLGHVRDEDIDKNIDLDIFLKYMKPIFEREDVLIIGQNLKFDLHVMTRLGIHIKTKDLFDTMLASWLCDENSPNGLKENSLSKMKISQTHFSEATDTVPSEVKKQFGFKANSRVTFDLVLIEDGAPYAIDDAYYTWCLYWGFDYELDKEGMRSIYYKMYIPFLRVLYEMEEKGVTVDIEKLRKMGEDMQSDLDELQYKIFELAEVEFNIGSNQQKAEILFGYRKPNNKSGKSTVNENIIAHSFDFPITTTTKSGAPSTDSDTIWRLSQKTFKNKRKMQGVEMCKLLLEYSKLSKLKTAFADGILEQIYKDGKVHPSFNQIGTDSGRISCSSPNLQQLPKAEDEDKYQIRSVFIGSLDENTGKRMKIIALDYHNLEMVCLTHFSGDKNLTEMFANDDDAHGSTAVNMFNLDCEPSEAKKKYPHLRQAAKVINFMLMYGGGASTLYENLKSDHYSPLDLGSPEYLKQYNKRNGVEVAQCFIDKYFESYSGVAKFIRSQKKLAHRQKYVNTILGRKRRLPDINSSDGAMSSYCERLSVNSAIQGTAGDITINAQIRVAANERLREMNCNMLIQVHDELVFECPEEYVEEAIPLIKNLMEHPFGDDPKRQVKFLRADADFGDNYQQAK